MPYWTRHSYNCYKLLGCMYCDYSSFWFSSIDIKYSDNFNNCFRCYNSSHITCCSNVWYGNHLLYCSWEHRKYSVFNVYVWEEEFKRVYNEIRFVNISIDFSDEAQNEALRVLKDDSTKMPEYIYKKAMQEAWDDLSKDNKETITKCKYFSKEVFKEVTWITI